MASLTGNERPRRSFAGPARTFDWLVVGAGLTGATMAERLASQLGQRVLVIDRRPHIAGNAYDEVHDGIRVHRYGAHLFHTDSETVWRYLSGFTEWRPYEHRVLADLTGRLLAMPCNLDTIETLVGRVEGARCSRALADAFGLGARVPVLRLMQHPEPLLAELGRLVHDRLFVNYTTKQWGRPPAELDPAVTGRVPVVVSHDDRYFHDAHQALPAEGYTAMVRRMLDHPLITVATSTDHRSLGVHARFRRVVFTGPIDEYFDHEHGSLPYRSLRFEDEWLEHGPYQPVSVVNHPNRHPYTRVIEHAHFAGGPGRAGGPGGTGGGGGPGGPGGGPTLITREVPEEHRPGDNEPYYPLPIRSARERYGRYAALAEEQAPTTVFAGRLAKYRYLDMDEAVAQALQIFKRRICASPTAA